MTPEKLNYVYKINHTFFCCLSNHRNGKNINTLNNLENWYGTRELNAAKGMKKKRGNDCGYRSLQRNKVKGKEC